MSIEGSVEGSGSIKKTAPFKNQGGVPPTEEEIGEFNNGSNKRSILERVVGSKKARAAALVALPAGGLQAAHTLNPDIPSVPGVIRSINDSAQDLDNSVRELFPPPTKNDTFNPRRSGTIGPENTISVSQQEAINLINKKTEEEGGLFFSLPSNTDHPVGFKRENEITAIEEIPVGTVITSPYDGILRLETYENDPTLVMHLTGINITEEDSKGLSMQIVVSGAKFLIPQEEYSKSEMGPQGNKTIITSDIPVTAGQNIAEIISQDKIKGSYEETIGNYQIIYRWAELLSENNKAVIATLE